MNKIFHFKRKKLKTERGSKKPVNATSGPSVQSKPRRKPAVKPDNTKKNSNKPESTAAISSLLTEENVIKQSAAELIGTSKTGHMTPEEVVRHLESRRAQQSQLDFSFAPDKAPATVPTEMFSNDIESRFFLFIFKFSNPEVINFLNFVFKLREAIFLNFWTTWTHRQVITAAMKTTSRSIWSIIIE